MYSLLDLVNWYRVVNRHTADHLKQAIYREMHYKVELSEGFIPLCQLIQETKDKKLKEALDTTLKLKKLHTKLQEDAQHIPLWKAYQAIGVI